MLIGPVSFSRARRGLSPHSFKITVFTTGGTTTEQPVINFSIVRAAAS